MVVLYADEQPDPRSDHKLQNGLPLRRASARIKLLEAKNSNAGLKTPTEERVASGSEKTGRVDESRKIKGPRSTENGEDEKLPVRLNPREKREAPSSNKVVQTKKKRKIERDEANQNAESTAGVATSGRPTAAADSTACAAKVIETLRSFNKHYLHSIQEEESRCAKQEADRKKNMMKKGSKSKEDYTAEACAKRPSKRPDLKAITEMKKSGTTLNPEKRFGPIPGIEVGHQFFSRAEMVVVGFHHHWLNGIDYIGQSASAAAKSVNELGSYKLPLAISIVLSGQYEDDLDNCEEVVYTGQGGNDLLGNKRQISDQVMERGNLGLKNCMEQSVPVRVVRGHKCRDSYVQKVYTYDGLYKVVKYWAEKGKSGFTVYKFRLKRLEGQPPLTTKEVSFTRGQVPKTLLDAEGLKCNDITGGLEDIPIPVTNVVDDATISASGFVYIKGMKFGKNITVPTVAPEGCNCKDACTDPRICACAKLNGGDFPYVQSGRLVEPKAVVFECGPNCGCGPKCMNRTCQSGPRFRLEIFRTPKKGWGVRSWDYIRSGSPICEYIGLLKRTHDLDPAADNSYVFDIDCLQTMKGLDGRESRLRDVSLPSYLQKAGENVSESVPFCIDAGQTGNVARFINHSCQPNLFVQCMLSNHHDIKLARIVLIAADNIPPLKELTYDYGYALDSVTGPDGKIQQMPCYCGADECRKRLY